MDRLFPIRQMGRSCRYFQANYPDGTMIELVALSYAVAYAHRRLEILRQVNLRLEQGSMTGLQGPSGSGKSTLLAMIAGVERPTGGAVRVNGVDYATLDQDGLARFRRQHIGIVFQQFHLLPDLTALENVALPLDLAGRADAASRARVWLNAVGLVDRHGQRAGFLSGGEQQRVAIARAFVAEPALILADEPTGNLDRQTGRRILDLLAGLNRELGTTLLLVTHDPDAAERMDQELHLIDGQLTNEGNL